VPCVVTALASLGWGRWPPSLSCGSPFPGRSALRALMVSPVVVPTIVLSIGLYSVYARWRLIETAAGLVLAHTVLALPFVVLNVTAVLYKLDLLAGKRAARSLGGGATSHVHAGDAAAALGPASPAGRSLRS